MAVVLVRHLLLYSILESIIFYVTAINSTHLSGQGDHRVVECAVVVFVPCSNSSDSASSGRCDPFIYSAILQALEDISINGSVFRDDLPEELYVELRISNLISTSDPYHALVQYLTTVSNMKAETCGGVVGPSSNSVTELLAHRTTVVNNMDVMVSYGADDVLFDMEKDSFSALYRTLPSREAVNRVLVCLMQRHYWTRVAVVSSSTSTQHSRAAENFVSLASQSRLFHVIEVYTFPGFSAVKDEVSDTYLNSGIYTRILFGNWIFNNFKIHVLYLPPFESRSILCQAMRIEPSLLDQSHVWILPYRYSDSWWLTQTDTKFLPTNQNCSNEEMDTIIAGINLVVVDSLNYNVPGLHENVKLGPNYYDIKSKPSELLPKIKEKASALNLSSDSSTRDVKNSRAMAAYDSVWTLALAYHDIVKNNVSLNQEEFMRGISRLKFNGASKPHNFMSAESQDFAATVLVAQQDEGNLHPIFLVSQSGGGSVNYCINISLSSATQNVEFLQSLGFNTSYSWFMWKGATPTNGYILETTFVPLYQLMVAFALDLVVVGVCITMLVLMVKLRNNKHIKSMAPRYSLVGFSALLTLVLSNVFYGLNFSAIKFGFNNATHQFLCKGSYTFIYLGLLLCNAIFLAKGWRIYRIFYNHKQKGHIIGISDISLSIIIISIMLPYIVLLVTKEAAFPSQPISQCFIINAFTEVNFTTCNDKYLGVGFFLARAIDSYLFIFTFPMAFMSFKNNRISNPRFREEGMSNSIYGKVILIISPIYAVLIVYSWVEANNSNKAVLVFWIIFMYTTIMPVALYLVVLLPKFLKIHEEHQKKKYTLLQKNNPASSRLASLQQDRTRLKKLIEQKEEKIAELKQLTRT